MLLEEIKPPFFKTNPKIQKLVQKYGIPSKEVLSALRGKKKKCGPEYDVVKKANLHEMTLSGVQTQSDQKMEPYFAFIKDNGEVVGHQGGKDILKASHQNTIFYAISDGENIISIASFTPTDKQNIWQLGFIHTLEGSREKGDIFRLLWFIKDQEGKSFIDYGSQTNDGMRFVKALAQTKRFSVKWFNTKTGETKPYDHKSDSIDSPFRSETGMTDWRIMVENSTSPSFPRFRDSMIPSKYLKEGFKASMHEFCELFDTDINYGF